MSHGSRSRDPRQRPAMREIMLAPDVPSLSRDRFLRRFGITLDNLTSLCNGTTSGAVIEVEVKARRTRRALAERPMAQAEKSRQLAAARTEASENPELALLVAEQDTDARIGHRVPKRVWLISLDAPAFGADTDSLYDLLTAVHRRGEDPFEAPFVPYVIAKVDRERELAAL